MSFMDIEKIIGSPMQIPLDLNSGEEYYQTIKNDNYADDEMSEIDNNDDIDMSDNSIEYYNPDPDDDCYYNQQTQEYYYQQLEKQHKQRQQEIKQQQEIIQKQQQEEQYKKFIESLRFMSLNEHHRMVYQDSNHCVIQMEFELL